LAPFPQLARAVSSRGEKAAFAEFLAQLGELRAVEHDARKIARFQRRAA